MAGSCHVCVSLSVSRFSADSVVAGRTGTFIGIDAALDVIVSRADLAGSEPVLLSNVVEWMSSCRANLVGTQVRCVFHIILSSLSSDAAASPGTI